MKTEKQATPGSNCPSFYVDEAGDGVLFGPKGRNRLQDPDASQFFMLGMVRCGNDRQIENALSTLRQQLLSNPLYSSIPSMQSEAMKTARAFHAKNDHPEVRAKVFEALAELDFRFFAVIKDMRAVKRYVDDRNRMHMEKERSHTPEIVVRPAYPWEAPCLQVADYCLWALQRCYEKIEPRFLHKIWEKVSLIHDVDDPSGKEYGKYFSRKAKPPDLNAIKDRWI